MPKISEIAFFLYPQNFLALRYLLKFSSSDCDEFKMVDQDWSRKDPAAEARNRNVEGTLEFMYYKY